MKALHKKESLTLSNIHDVPSDITFDKFPVIDRRSYSEHLTNFLNSKAKDGYVLNLNAEWGAGKTTFLRCWYNELKKDHPVVYFDAWKSDFTHDAMLALLEAFHSQLMNAVTENKELYKDIIEKGSYFIKSILPSLAVGYIKQKTGLDSDDSIFTEFAEDIGLDSNELTGALRDTFKLMLEQKQKVQGVQDFQKTLHGLSEAYLEVHKGSKEAPIYVLIDELDRCRPTYAIEVIESVKHFFNTKNFVFVLATDTEQLQHSIKAVYGQDFDSSSYLSRFFNNTVTLEAPDIYEFIQIKLPELSNTTPVEKIALLYIQELFQWHGIESLRDIDKVFDCVEIARSKNKCFKIFPLILLAILKTKFPKYYSKYSSIGGVCYNSSSTGSRRQNNDLDLVPGKIYSQFKITNQSKIYTDYLLQLSLNFIDHELQEGFLLKINTKIDSAQVNTHFSQFTSIALLNSDLDLAEKKDYLSVLNFAGHFQ
ncbi:P-loop NTPase fold protein [Vibrio plantisponsor]|uniref:KAP family P-loop NTPase fold protein n=1 Tax=Vibrio plantisponsor TaxID=664643 RepID=UPI00370A3B15